MRPRCAPWAFHVRLFLRGHLAVEVVDLVDDVAHLVGGVIHVCAQPGTGTSMVSLGDILVERVDDGPADVALIIPVQFLALIVHFLLILVVVSPGYTNFKLGDSRALPWDSAVKAVNLIAEDKAGVSQVDGGGVRRWDGKELVDEAGRQSLDAVGVRARGETWQGANHRGGPSS